jgi:hypothetical protein
MKLTNLRFYDGAREKVCRLGMADLFFELLEILLGLEVFLLEEKEANGAAALRSIIDERFKAIGGWVHRRTGDVDWKKRLKYNETIVVTLGVEVQVSARSALLYRDIVHVRNALQQGAIDVGVIVVPDDRLQRFLPDRTPRFRDAVRCIEQEFKEAMTYPIVLISIEHDGPGDPLPKRPRSR